MGKVGGGNADPRYYLDTVASGAEDYYSGRGEAPGQWAGRGAAVRGLSGTVEDEAFIAQLTADGGPAKTVLAYDLTFSAPKSVSLLFGIGDERLSRVVREAHDHAVTQALAYIEREACWTRRGAGGREVTRGDGLTVALFRHRSSRAGDPQLHTHSVVVNATEAGGRTTALDGRAIYAHGRTAGFLYEAALRDQLTRSLGVEWGPVENGIAEIAGIDREVLRHFSRRREEILEHMARRGGRSWRSAQIAALETRRAKDYDVPADRLRDEWRARAGEMGFGPSELQALLSRPAVERPAAPMRDELDAELSSERGITRQASTFDRRDVLREVAAMLREGATVEQVEELADHWLSSHDVVRLDAGERRQHLGGARYSTRDMIALEQRVVRDAAARRNRDVATVPAPKVDAVLDAAPELAGEQAEMVRRLTQSGDGVQLVRAPAGAGKTRALAAARDAWEASGTPVYGCALAARAAVELETTAGIDSTTIARFLQDVERGHSLQPGSVLVVDEAGMVGSRTIDRLARHTAETDSKLLLVGDDRQLPEIDAGGAFRGLADRLGAVELHTVHRQAQEWDRDALAQLRVGKVQAWAAAYREHDRIVARPTARETRTVLVEDWWQTARTDEADAVMIAHRRADVAELNALARARMRDDGRLGTEELTTAEGRTFAVGDHVLARHNDHRADVVNGLRARVTEIDADRRSVTIQPKDGKPRTIESRYLDEGWLDHGYALTAHAAQGATVDRAYVLGSDELYREWGYTALTRHRDSARFYLVSPGSAERALPGMDPTQDQLADDLKDILAPSRRKRLAIDTATEEIAFAESRIDALAEERSNLRPWQRAKRKDIDKLVALQHGSIERWEATRAAPRTKPQPPTPAVTRQEPAVSRDELRAGMAAPAAHLTTRIGERPDTITEREQWCRAAANLIARAVPPPSPTLDVDTLADLGPEL